MKANGYGEIVERFRGRIHAGELESGTRLPSIRELAASFDVNYATAQRAIMELQRAGYVVAQGRHGCTVTDDWTRLTPTPNGAKTTSARPLRLGMLVGESAAQSGEHPPQLVSLERMLTARVCADGGSVIRFPLPDGSMQPSSGLVQEICRAPIDVLVIANSWARLDAGTYRLLEHAGKSCVIYAGTLVEAPDRDLVRIDDVWAFQTITERLWQMGHRRLAYVGFTPEPLGWEWNRARLAAWRESMASLGAKTTERDVIQLADLRWAGGVPQRLATYDAVVCANDRLAGFVIETLGVLGVRVPEDVSVTGYDNMCDDRAPAGVTTFSLPYERVVAAILSIATRRVLHDEEAGDRMTITLRPVLIPRATWQTRADRAAATKLAKDGSGRQGRR